jgi:hypothetical protein
MCTTHVEALTIKRPLTVYKIVLRKEGNEAADPKYISPFYKKRIRYDVINGIVPYEADLPRERLHWDYEFKTYAARGFVHAYCDMDSACNDFEFYIENFVNDTGYVPELWECEIPVAQKSDADTYCVKGIFDLQEDSYCVAARRMYFKKRIGYGDIAERRRKNRKRAYINEKNIIDKLQWKEKTVNS